MARLQCTYRDMHSTARRKIGEVERTKEWQYEVYLDGKFQLKVTVPDSHGSATAHIRLGTLNEIRKQLKLERDEFILWLRCPIGRSEYEQILRQRLGL
jgi:hypothetical protein